MDKKRRVDVIQAFAAATAEVFDKMCQVEATAGNPYLETSNNRLYGVSGIMRTTGDLNAIVVLTMPDAPAIKTVNTMTSTGYTTLNNLVLDGIREIANIIVGAAKARLDDKGYSFDMSLPKVVVGTTFTNNYGYCPRVVVIPFQTSMGAFILDIAFKQQEEGAAVGSSARMQARAG